MGSVEVSYYDVKLQLQKVELPLMLVLVIPLILGFLISWILCMFERFKLKSTIRQQNRSITSIEEELETLKNTPQLPAHVETSNDS